MAEVVGIVGAGTMGSGIAQVCLVHGYRVRLHDADPGALDRAREAVAAGLDRLVKKGQLEPTTRDEASGALSLHADLESAVADAGVVIEAAPEDRLVKERLFAALDAAAPADALLATNTSSLSVTTCALATRTPERVIGLHFFNPVPRMALVEVATTELGSPSVTDRALAFVRSLGKTPLHCADSPGFIVNRVARPYLLEAVRLLEAGRGSVAAIDAALEAAGYPMGPFRLIDLIGLDVDLAIDAALFEAFGEAERFRPPQLQVRFAAEGRLGRKTGAGFYAYGASGAAPSEIPDLPPASSEATLPPEAVVERLEMAMINEAYRAVEEGVARPPDVDTAMKLGAGHPSGPFERVDQLGLRMIVERLHALDRESRSTSGDQYEVAPLIWRVATV